MIQWSLLSRWFSMDFPEFFNLASPDTFGDTYRPLPLPLLPGSQLSFGAYISHFCVSPAQSPTLCNALALCLPPSSEVKSRGTVGCYTSAGEQPGYSLLTRQLSMCGITLQNTLPYVLRLPPQIMHTPYSGTPCSFMYRWDVSPSEGEGVQSWGC